MDSNFGVVFSRLSKLAVVAALACSIGLHWAFFQSVAWMGMIVSYSHDAPLTEALTKTFDGKHPCCLCKQIAKGKQSEKKSEPAPVVKKLELLCSSTIFVFCNTSPGYEIQWPERFWSSVLQTPRLPPPRQLPG